MQQQYVPPIYGERAFNCPHCLAYSQQRWYETDVSLKDNSCSIKSHLRGSIDPTAELVNDYRIDNATAMSLCYRCEEMALWVNGKMIHPRFSTAPLPNPDMPEDVLKLYNEAREVSALSPRASTALLRLALEKLLPQVGAKKAGIDNMIGELVGKGLSKDIEKALDVLRVIGNEAVHPGTIDLDDNTEVAFALFKLLNVVVDRMITEQKQIDEIYSLIPEGKLKGIHDRNNRVLNK